MYFTKEYITGKPLDLKKYTLGYIKQPIIDYFMYDYNFIDFIKPYYMGITLSYDDISKDSKLYFSYFLQAMGESNGIMNSFYKGLTLIYDTSFDDMEFFKDKEGNIVLRIDRKDTKKDKDKGEALAFISDENFLVLCEVVLEMCLFEKPKEEGELKGDPELVKRFKEQQRKYFQNKKNEDNILFENMVREVMYFQGIHSYDDIKDTTIWWLRDAYSVETLRNSESKQWQMASGGRYSPKKIKSWQKITKIKK